MPILITTVDSVSTNDGLGNIAEENYLYASGTYYYKNPYDKKFAGFGRVEKTDAEGNVAKTFFTREIQVILQTENITIILQKQEGLIVSSSMTTRKIFSLKP